MVFNNPIFQREIKGAVRDPKFVTLILGFIAILSLVLLFLWPASGVYSLATDSSKQIFTIFLMSNLALVILLVPALTSSSITVERENNSYDLLFTSLLRPGEILAGKLFSAIATILLVVLVSMPISAICSLSGGIGPALLLRAYAIIVMAALTYGIMGLAISSMCRSTFNSLMISYILVAVLAGATWLPYMLLGRLDRMRWVWLAIRSLSPFDALIALLYPGHYQTTVISRVSADPLVPVYLHLAGMGLLLLIFLLAFCRYVLAAPKPGLLWSWLGIVLIGGLLLLIGTEANILYLVHIGSEAIYAVVPWATMQTFGAIALAADLLLIMIIITCFRKARTEGQKYHAQFTDLRTMVKRKLTFPFYLFDPLRRKASIGRLWNPVYVAEMRSKIFGNPRFIILGVAGCIIVAMVLLLLVCFQYASALQPDTVRWVAIVFQIGIIAILAPAISSGAITDEINSRTFLMLRMTPLSAFSVVAGKMLASFLYVSIFLISSLPVLFALCYLDIMTADDITLQAFTRVGIWIAIMVASTITFITAGFCASAFSRNTSGATAMSYCVAAVLCIVTLAGVIPGAFGDSTRNALLTANPVVAALRVTSDHMFTDLPPDTWQYNLVFLISLSLIFVAASAWRVIYIFRKRD